MGKSLVHPNNHDKLGVTKSANAVVFWHFDLGSDDTCTRGEPLFLSLVKLAIDMWNKSSSISITHYSTPFSLDDMDLVGWNYIVLCRYAALRRN